MPRRILLIDDSPLIIAAAEVALKNAGYEVASATTLEEFETHRRTAPPDLIVLDVQMPEIFGDDLASTLIGAYAESAPIILLSSLDEAELAERAQAASARAWVSKRAGMRALLEKVEEVFGASRA